MEITNSFPYICKDNKNNWNMLKKNTDYFQSTQYSGFRIKSLSTCNISNNYLVILVVIYMNLFLCIRES